jgi:hypothetical protein
MSEKYRQFALQAGVSRLVTWLEDDKRLKVGARLTLAKGPAADEATVWTVAQRYSEVRDVPPNRDWKVGGLV